MHTSLAETFAIPAEFDIPPNDHLRAALAAAEAGGRVVLHYFERGVEMHDKGTVELVSQADVESEQAIARVLAARFPDHAVLGEEEHSGSVSAEHLWIVDPLDGTNNFAHRIPHFAVSIAYYAGQVAQCGVVVNPVRGDWYWATRGGGAFYNGQPIKVNNEARLDQTMVGVGFYYDRGAMMEATLAAVGDFFRQQIHGIRRFGTAALDLCQTACGMFGVYFEYQLSPWDFAAGRLILEEAGGLITDGRGNPLPLAKTSILASNTQLHPAALAIVAKHHL
ncbi:MAG: inositol monophosphatase family protein [Aureliella sp.]